MTGRVKEYGAAVRAARRSRGLTQAQLGRLLRCDASTVSKIERAAVGLIHFQIIFAIEFHLGVKP